MVNLKNIDELIRSWDELVNECIDGYNSTVFELDYDLLIRKELEEILDSKELFNYEKYKLKIYKIDEKFKKIIIFLDKKEDCFFWNRKFILKYGTEPYCESVYDNFKIHIDGKG
jgi:hypothetical protein